MLNSTPPLAEITSHRLVVINHHEARIFHSEMSGSVPRRVLPHRPDEHFHHPRHTLDFSRGQEKPDPSIFFPPLAKALQGAGQILLFGSGKGGGSAMEQFRQWLDQQHPELGRLVLGTVVLDLSHLSEAELLAAARQFYATLPAR